MKNIAFAIFALAALMGCSQSEANFRASLKYPICVRLAGQPDLNPKVEKAYDFEVVRLKTDKLDGTIYVGDFPDYPKFSPDRKYYEPLGQVTYVGKSTVTQYQNRLFRFGLGKESAVHVLFSFSVNGSPSFYTTEQLDGVVSKCS